MAKFYHQRGSKFNPDDSIAPFTSYSSKMLKQRAEEVITLEKFYSDQGKDINDQPHMDCISRTLTRRRKDWCDIENVIHHEQPMSDNLEKIVNAWKTLSKKLPSMNL